jgi:oxygen-dependent protoporphyrinogen oxidase
MHVAVVGGGLAGLTAALELADGGHAITVLEASARFGGQIRTERHDGFVVEQGAEGFVARSEAVSALCRRTGIAAGLVAQTTRRALAWRDGQLSELRDGEAAGLLGIPVNPEDLGQGLRSLFGGMGDLIDSLLGSLDRRAGLRTEARVTALRRGKAWRLDCAGGETLEADAVILATPPQETELLVEPMLGDAALGGQLRYGSTVTVTLAYARGAVAHPLDASGFVVDGPDRSGLRACTFSSTKFSGRAPAGWCLLRAFFSAEPHAIAQNDESWSALAHRLLAPILGLSGHPDARWVYRWPTALPRYAPGYLAAVTRLRSSLAQLGALDCAGGSLDGGGIDGAVRSGLIAAREIIRRCHAGGGRGVGVEVSQGT